MSLLSEGDSYSPISSLSGRTEGAPIVFDPVTNLTFQLGFDRSVFPPRAVWIAVSTWGLARPHWGSWNIVRAQDLTWGLAKTEIGEPT